MSPQYDYSLLKRHGDNTFISANVEIRRPNLVTVGSHKAIDTGFYCTSLLNPQSVFENFTIAISFFDGKIPIGGVQRTAAKQ